MQKLEDVLDTMVSGQTYLCSMSDDSQFEQGAEYAVYQDDDGFVFIEDEHGDPVYSADDLYSDGVVFTLVGKIKALNTIELPNLVVEKIVKPEITLTPSKIQETVSRLNGQTPGQAKLTSLTQVSSEKKQVDLDLAHLLLTSEAVKALKPGEDCIVTSLVVDHHTSKVTLGLSVGKVVKEETEAVRVALEDLLKN